MDLSQRDLLAVVDLLEAMERLSNGDKDGATELAGRVFEANPDVACGWLLSFAAQSVEQTAAALGCFPSDLYALARQGWGRLALESES